MASLKSWGKLQFPGTSSFPYNFSCAPCWGNCKHWTSKQRFANSYYSHCYDGTESKICLYIVNNKMHKLWYVWTFVLQINCEKSPKRNWWLIYHLLRPPDFQSCCEKETNKLVPILSIAAILLLLHYQCSWKQVTQLLQFRQQAKKQSNYHHMTEISSRNSAKLMDLKGRVQKHQSRKNPVWWTTPF